MSIIEQIIRAQNSEDFRKLNPTFFPESHAAKPSMSHPERNGTLLIQESTDLQKLNKTERLFWDWLEHGRKMRLWDWIGVQCMTLKLADDCRYTPDFWAYAPSGKIIRRVNEYPF